MIRDEYTMEGDGDQSNETAHKTRHPLTKNPSSLPSPSDNYLAVHTEEESIMASTLLNIRGGPSKSEKTAGSAAPASKVPKTTTEAQVGRSPPGVVVPTASPGALSAASARLLGRPMAPLSSQNLLILQTQLEMAAGLSSAGMSPSAAAAFSSTFPGFTVNQQNNFAAAAAATSILNNAHQQQQQQQQQLTPIQPRPQDQLQALSSNSTLHARHQQLTAQLQQQGRGEAPQPSRTSVSPAMTTTTTSSATTMPTLESMLSNNSDICSATSKSNPSQEKVQAALKSKPQRGRKREDLNDLERMELTRTRNREHAKSTRIRKKARYQELLDTEARLQHMQNQEQLQMHRREAVLEFLSARSKVLQAKLKSSEAATAAAAIGSNNSQDTSLTPSQVEQLLVGLIVQEDDDSGDVFEYMQGNMAPSKCKGLSTAVAWMGEFDKSIIQVATAAEQQQEQARKNRVHAIHYRVSRSDNGDEDHQQQQHADAGKAIALSSDSALIKVDVGADFVSTAAAHYDDDDRSSLVLMTMLVEISFGRDSCKMRSISSTILSRNDNISHNNKKNGDNNGRLNAQFSYPSVVSLERGRLSRGLSFLDETPSPLSPMHSSSSSPTKKHHDYGDAKHHSEDESPGMSI